MLGNIDAVDHPGRVAQGRYPRAMTPQPPTLQVHPIRLRAKSPAHVRALAIASDENPDHVRATRMATLAALGCVLLLVASQLLGCAPTWGDAVTAAGQVGKAVACAVCSASVPPVPVVDPVKPSVGEAARLLAWTAAMIDLLQRVVQRGAFEAALASPTAAAPAPPAAPSVAAPK